MLAQKRSRPVPSLVATSPQTPSTVWTRSRRAGKLAGWQAGCSFTFRQLVVCNMHAGHGQGQKGGPCFRAEPAQRAGRLTKQHRAGRRWQCIRSAILSAQVGGFSAGLQVAMTWRHLQPVAIRKRLTPEAMLHGERACWPAGLAMVTGSSTRLPYHGMS